MRGPEPHRLRRPGGRAVLRRHHGAVRGRQPAREWRSDMVRMISYGAIDARIKPGTPGPRCRLVSAAASSAAVSVLEACPDQPDLRLTLLRPAKEEDDPRPEVRAAARRRRTTPSARVIAVSDTTTAVYLPTPQAVGHRSSTRPASTIANLPLPKPASPEAAASRAGNLITWWTGDAVMVFAANGCTTATPSPAGAARAGRSGAMMAGRLLIPVTDGIGVYDPVDGSRRALHPGDRPPAQSAGGARRRRLDAARAARRHDRRAGRSR